MARVLLVGCGCRARELARSLRDGGYSVRGTTRDPASLPAIEAAGAEAVLADPDRLGTIVAELQGVSVVCWLLGSAEGEPEAVAALHGPRLESLLDSLVDSPARGLVYEGAGSVDAGLLERGAAAVRAAGDRHRMPVATFTADPGDQAGWQRAASDAVGRVLSG